MTNFRVVKEHRQAFSVFAYKESLGITKKYPKQFAVWADDKDDARKQFLAGHPGWKVVKIER